MENKMKTTTMKNTGYFLITAYSDILEKNYTERVAMKKTIRKPENHLKKAFKNLISWEMIDKETFYIEDGLFVIL
jgi:hypothetical protein